MKAKQTFEEYLRKHDYILSVDSELFFGTLWHCKQRKFTCIQRLFNGIFQAKDGEFAYTSDEQVLGIFEKTAVAVKSCKGTAEEFFRKCYQQCRL